MICATQNLTSNILDLFLKNMFLERRYWLLKQFRGRKEKKTHKTGDLFLQYFMNKVGSY